MLLVALVMTDKRWAAAKVNDVRVSPPAKQPSVGFADVDRYDLIDPSATPFRRRSERTEDKNKILKNYVLLSLENGGRKRIRGTREKTLIMMTKKKEEICRRRQPILDGAKAHPAQTAKTHKEQKGGSIAIPLLVNQWQSKRPRYVWRNVSLETLGTRREKEKKRGALKRQRLYIGVSLIMTAATTITIESPGFSFPIWSGGPLFLHPSPTAVMSFFYLLIHFCRARLHKAFAFLYSLSYFSFILHSFFSWFSLSL